MWKDILELVGLLLCVALCATLVSASSLLITFIVFSFFDILKSKNPLDVIILLYIVVSILYTILNKVNKHLNKENTNIEIKG